MKENDQFEDYENLSLNEKLDMSIDKESDNIAIYNKSGEIRMTMVSDKKLNLHKDKSFEEETGIHSLGIKSPKKSISSQNIDNLKASMTESYYRNEDWENLEDERNLENNFDLENELNAGSIILNASQISGQHSSSGIITDYVVPDLITNEPVKAVGLTEEQIKEEFMKKNYQSNFSMGGGYDDIDAVSYTHLTLPTTPYV